MMGYAKLFGLVGLLVSGFGAGWFVNGTIAEAHLAQVTLAFNEAMQLQDEEVDKANLKAKQNEIDLHARYSKGLGVMWSLKMKRERESFGRVKLFKKEKRANERLKDWSAVHHPNYVTEWLRDLSAARETSGG